MSITDEILSIKELQSQIRATIDCRMSLVSLYGETKNLETMVENYKSDGKFNDIPVEIKTALNRFYQMFLQLKAAIENDPAFSELIDY